MNKKRLGSKRILVLTLIPLLAIVLTTLAYGALQNYITLGINLTTGQKPTIALTCALVNTYNNPVILFVNSTTKIIETTEPPFLLFYINITNNGRTPIDKIILSDTIHKDWTLQEVLVQLLQADETLVEINENYFTIEYKPENNIILTISSIKNALGKTLNQNESIMISLYFVYDLIGQQIPPEYETNPPTYTNSVATTAWIESWQSQPTTTTLDFTTNITEP